MLYESREELDAIKSKSKKLQISKIQDMTELGDLKRVKLYLQIPEGVEPVIRIKAPQLRVVIVFD